MECAFWDSGRWYANRVSATPEEALALVLTIAMVVGMGAQRGRSTAATRSPPLLPLAGMLGVYAALHDVAPAIVLAALAVTAMLTALYVIRMGHRPPLAFYGLVALSLPVLPSLQFVLGLPMRVVSAAMTVALLKLQGVAVERQGTHLLWNGDMIQFDAPCSGVNMLWAGLMLTLMACVLWRARALFTIVAILASLMLTLLANVLRTTSLFFVEAGLLIGMPAWSHEAIGLTAFVLSAALILAALSRLRGWEACQ
jgi:exosortase/archaeosortase family protein